MNGIDTAKEKLYMLGVSTGLEFVFVMDTTLEDMARWTRIKNTWLSE